MAWIARVLRADAIMEFALAALCLAAAVAVPAGTMPGWLSQPVLVVLGIVLIAAGVLLLWLSGRPAASTLPAVGVGNAVTAAVIILVGTIAPGADAGLRIVIIACAVIIGGLALIQLLIAQRAS